MNKKEYFSKKTPGHPPSHRIFPNPYKHKSVEITEVFGNAHKALHVPFIARKIGKLGPSRPYSTRKTQSYIVKTVGNTEDSESPEFSESPKFNVFDYDSISHNHAGLNELTKLLAHHRTESSSSDISTDSSHGSLAYSSVTTESMGSLAGIEILIDGDTSGETTPDSSLPENFDSSESSNESKESAETGSADSAQNSDLEGYRNLLKSTKEIPQKVHSRLTALATQNYAQVAAKLLSHNIEPLLNDPSLKRGLKTPAQERKIKALKSLTQELTSIASGTKNSLPETQEYLAHFFDSLKTHLNNRQLALGDEFWHINALLESYVQSCNVVFEQQYISDVAEYLCQNSDPELRSVAVDELLDFPIQRAHYLSESAAAQKEVLSQEILRFLAPTIAIGVNPFPKYRLMIQEDRSSEERVLPKAPQVLIGSSKIDFGADVSSSNYHGMAGCKRLAFMSQGQAYLWEKVRGLAWVYFASAFTSDIDLRPSNLGYRVYQTKGERSITATKIDGGFGFTGPAIAFQQHFDMQNPYIPSAPENYYNRYPVVAGGVSQSNPINTQYHEFLKDLARSDQSLRETNLGILTCALLGPEKYELFVQQYLSHDQNPFLRGIDKESKRFYRAVTYDTIVEEHLKPHAQRCFDELLNNDAIFDFFLSESSERNLFVAYQQFLEQTLSFKPYESRTWKEIDPHCMQDMQQRLETLLIKRLEKDPGQSQKILQALSAWQPKEISPKNGFLVAHTQSFQKKLGVTIRQKAIELAKSKSSEVRQGSEVCESSKDGKSLFVGAKSHIPTPSSSTKNK